MADHKKKPYTISRHSDGTVSLTAAGMTETFSSEHALNSFAFRLAEAISNRRSSAFRLQDLSDGRLGIEMRKAHHTIICKDYDKATQFAEMLYNDTKSKQQ